MAQTRPRESTAIVSDSVESSMIRERPVRVNSSRSPAWKVRRYAGFPGCVVALDGATTCVAIRKVCPSQCTSARAFSRVSTRASVLTHPDASCRKISHAPLASLYSTAYQRSSCTQVLLCCLSAVGAVTEE